jgi:hypothetical protein
MNRYSHCEYPFKTRRLYSLLAMLMLVQSASANRMRRCVAAWHASMRSGQIMKLFEITLRSCSSLNFSPEKEMLVYACQLTCTLLRCFQSRNVTKDALVKAPPISKTTTVCARFAALASSERASQDSSTSDQPPDCTASCSSSADVVMQPAFSHISKYLRRMRLAPRVGIERLTFRWGRSRAGADAALRSPRALRTRLAVSGR